MYRWFLFLYAFIMAVHGVAAQDIWLRPAKYFYEAGDTASIQFATGENFIAVPVLPVTGDIKRLELQNREGLRDIKPMLNNDPEAPVLVRGLRDGYQFLFFETQRDLKMEAEQFNDFLVQYGLETIQAERKKNNRLNTRATVRARNIVQLAFRVGRNEGQGWNKVMGHPIEIIPDKNPQTLKRGDRIHFTIYENGAPAFGVRVKIWNRWDKRTTIQNIYTEKNGMVSTTISNPGDWMVTVVKIRATDQPEEFLADVFTLNFGYR